ncbi:MAG: PAS domain S-box protein, partial [Lacibacter sp.]
MLFFSLLLPGAAIYQLITKNNWLKKEYSKQEAYVQQRDAFEKLSLYVKTVESNSRGYALTGNEQFLRDFNAQYDSINSITLQIKTSANPDKTISVAYAKLNRFIDEKILFLQKVNILTAQNRDSAVLLFAGTDGFNLSDSISIYSGVIIQKFNQQISKSKTGFWEVKNTNNKIAYSSLAAALLLICISFYLLLRENIRTKRIGRELEMQKERYRTTLSSMAEGVITTDKDGGIVYMNPAAELITGWKKQEAKNQPLHQVYDVSVESTGLPVTNIVSRILKEGVSIELENNTVLKTRNSGELIINNSGSPLFDNDGNINGAVLVFNDITTEKKNKLDLKESEEKYRNLIDHAADGIFILDQQGRFIDVNSSGCAMMGYTKEDVLQLNLSDITPPEFIDKMPINMNDLMSGKIMLIERQYQRKDGTKFYAEASAKLIAGGKIQSIVRDITQRKKAEEELKQSEERYRMFIEQATDGVLVYSYDGTIFDFNTAAYKQTGYTREEFKTLKLQDLLFDEAVIINSEVVARVKAGEQVLFTRKLKRKDGSVAEIEINSRILSDGRVLAFVRDITERKKAEVQIKNISERLSLATRSAKIGIWERDLVQQQLVWDDRMYELYETDSALSGVTIEAWKQRIHPDDLDRVMREVDKSINENSDYNTEFRIILPGQAIRYIESHALVTRNPEGKPLRMIGVNRDITDRKMTGMHLAESERKLRHVLSSSSESFYVLDKNYTVILINKAASANLEKAWGKPVTVGTNIFPLIPEEKDEPVRKNLAKVFADEKVEYELQLSIADLPEWVQVNYMPVKDGKGVITGAYISTKDITERKQSEMNLQKALDRYNILAKATSDTVWDWDMHTHMMRYNKGITTMFGYE